MDAAEIVEAIEIQIEPPFNPAEFPFTFLELLRRKAHLTFGDASSRTGDLAQY
jgi:hypothetical protein